MKTIRILGIDPGSHRTGIAILDKSGNALPKVIHHDTIESPPNAELPTALIILRKALLEVIEEFKPTHSSVEEIFFSKNLKTATRVFQARGVILLTLAEKDITIYQPTVTQIKKGVTSSGKADKKQIHSSLKLILKLGELKGLDDSWDAIAAGFVGFSFIPPNSK